jgi:hypothetical protein
MKEQITREKYVEMITKTNEKVEELMSMAAIGDEPEQLRKNIETMIEYLKFLSLNV